MEESACAGAALSARRRAAWRQGIGSAPGPLVPAGATVEEAGCVPEAGRVDARWHRLHYARLRERSNPTTASTRVPPIAPRLLLALMLAATVIPGAAAAGVGDAFVDPEDGAFDVSEWVLDKQGFIPVPIIVTEPAVGYGGGLTLLFFRESLRDAVTRSRPGHPTPPDIYVVAGAATENGTRFGAAGAMVTFRDDRWRYRGVVGRTDINLTFYGAGDRGIGFNLDGWASSQQLLQRIGDSHHFLAGRWVYFDLDNRFDSDASTPNLPEEGRSKRSSGIGPSWEYDSRNTIFTPSRGLLAAVDGLFYDPDWGSDSRFQTYRTKLFAYVPAGPRLVVGGRLDARFARGDVPFYQLPYIVLRGIPALRYQGENVAVAETELRWNPTPRWGLVGFAGAGSAWGPQDFEDVGTQFAGGTGFRYFLARRLNLHAGVDVGWGPEEHGIYFTIGNPWY